MTVYNGKKGKLNLTLWTWKCDPTERWYRYEWSSSPSMNHNLSTPLFLKVTGTLLYDTCSKCINKNTLPLRSSNTSAPLCTANVTKSMQFTVNGLCRSRLNYLSLDERITVTDIDALYIGANTVATHLQRYYRNKTGITAVFLISDDPVEVLDKNDF